MNKQNDGKGKRGIEWTDMTWNPVKGCNHKCKWTMPDGTIAICYAETIANKFTQVYPHGFEHHYWTPKALDEPLKLQAPAKIFLDSMSDLMGKWVPEEQIQQVLDVCHRAHWHTFQLLTKNAPRLEQFEFPSNVWVGVSAPPTSMLGHQLSLDQQKRLVDRQISALHNVRCAGVRWMSVEPLSFDIAPLLVDAPLDWVVIGAATNGFKTYQPEREWVVNLLNVLDGKNIPVFFKGNLKWDTWREEFPIPRPPMVENVPAPIVITADPTPAPQPEHKGVLVSKRFLMLTWLHNSQSAEIGLMRDTVTGHERYSISPVRGATPTKHLSVKQALELLANGEWSPVNAEIINGKVVKNVQYQAN